MPRPLVGGLLSPCPNTVQLSLLLLGNAIRWSLQVGKTYPKLIGSDFRNRQFQSCIEII